MEEDGGRAVGDALGVHPVQEAEVVDPPADVREEFGDRHAAVAILFELPRRSHGGHLGDLARARHFEGQLLAVVAVEFRLRVEGVDMARAALHEQEDDAFGACGVGAAAGGERVGGIGEAGEGEGAETAGGGFEELPARSRVDIWDAVHGVVRSAQSRKRNEMLAKRVCCRAVQALVSGSSPRKSRARASSALSAGRPKLAR